MATLVLTVIGDDRAGLVSALADVIAEHGGGWGRSQLTELAGKFAGIVLVEVPQSNVAALRAALEPLEGVLDTTVHEVGEPKAAAALAPLHLELVGNDRPGIIREISTVLADHEVSIGELDSRTTSAPMAGGQLFEVSATVHPSADTELDSLRSALEELAGELMVDISLEGSQR